MDTYDRDGMDIYKLREGVDAYHQIRKAHNDCKRTLEQVRIDVCGMVILVKSANLLEGTNSEGSVQVRNSGRRSVDGQGKTKRRCVESLLFGRKILDRGVAWELKNL
ncbi:hypothetical protein NPIL_567661, partial [Nephila pilipes]